MIETKQLNSNKDSNKDKGGFSVKGQIGIGISLFALILIAVGAVVFVVGNINLPEVRLGVVEYFEKRLSEEPSATAKETQKSILEEAGIAEGSSGEVASTQKFRIEWVAGPNNYWVEIRDRDVEAVKQEAMQWFLDKGFSKEDICSGAIPVLMYYGPGVQEELNIGKKPPPRFCE